MLLPFSCHTLGCDPEALQDVLLRSLSAVAHSDLAEISHKLSKPNASTERQPSATDDLAEQTTDGIKPEDCADEYERDASDPGVGDDDMHTLTNPTQRADAACDSWGSWHNAHDHGTTMDEHNCGTQHLAKRPKTAGCGDPVGCHAWMANVDPEITENPAMHTAVHDAGPATEEATCMCAITDQNSRDAAETVATESPDNWLF